MTKQKWSWFVGSDDCDEEMTSCASKEEAIILGNEIMEGSTFYIVEACFSKEHIQEMGDLLRDNAPFECERNGEWITAESVQP